jgi:hypothetical protein
MTTNAPTGYDDATRAELVRIRNALRPLVAGARAVPAPARPDPRRILDAVNHPDFWGGLCTETRRLIIWHGVADALNDLCRGDGARPEASRELGSTDRA